MCHAHLPGLLLVVLEARSPLIFGCANGPPFGRWSGRPGPERTRALRGTAQVRQEGSNGDREMAASRPKGLDNSESFNGAKDIGSLKFNIAIGPQYYFWVCVF